MRALFFVAAVLLAFWAARAIHDATWSPPFEVQP